MALTDQERLVVSLEARIRDFERNFRKAGRVANDNFVKIERRAKRSADRLEKTMAGASSRVNETLRNFGRGLLAGVAAGGVAGIVKQIGDVAEGIAAIGDRAKQAGLNAQEKCGAV